MVAVIQLKSFNSQNSESQCTHQTGTQENNIMQSTDETSNGTVRIYVDNLRVSRCMES